MNSPPISVQISWDWDVRWDWGYDLGCDPWLFFWGDVHLDGVGAWHQRPGCLTHRPAAHGKHGFVNDAEKRLQEEAGVAVFALFAGGFWTPGGAVFFFQA